MNNEKALREEFKKKYGNRISEYSVNIADWWIEKMSNQLKETSLDQYAMGQSEGMEYHEAKMKELKEKVEDMRFEMINMNGGLREDVIRVSDILNLLSSK